MYRLSERPKRRLLPSLRNPVGVVLWGAGWLAILFGGRWAFVGGVAFLAVWTAASWSMTLTADTDGLHVRNRFWRRHIHWSDVQSISSVRDTRPLRYGRSVVIRKRRIPRTVEVTAVDHLDPDSLDRIARELLLFAHSVGHDVARRDYR